MVKLLFVVLSLLILGLDAFSGTLESNDKIRLELGSMFETERKIELLSNAIYKSENKLYLLKSDIEIINSYIGKEEKALKENSKTFSDSLKELIKARNSGLAASLFSGKTLHQSATSNEVSRRIYDNVLTDTEKRMIRIKSLESEKNKVSKKLSQLKKKSKEFEGERKSLVRLQSQKKEKLQSLFKDAKKSKLTVNEFNKAYNIRLSEANIEGLKNDLRSSFFLSEGKVVHPTSNSIIRSYGFWRHPRHSYKRIYKGHTYKMSLKDNVYAVGPGVIKYIGPIVGDDNVIIVDHGGKYYSVYKGLLAANKNVGSRIKAKEVLAVTKKKSSLYFEIRHYSDPINLNRWMMARR